MELSVVFRVARAMGGAARAVGVEVVTGDTKVVESGHGDGVYINTAGIGIIPAGVDLRAQRVVPGDVVIVSGAIGLHGVAIMSVREGLEFGVDMESDCAPLAGLVRSMLAVTPDLHVLRDPTRGGGLAAALNEIATASGAGVLIHEARVPVPRPSRTPADPGPGAVLRGRRGQARGLRAARALRRGRARRDAGASAGAGGARNRRGRGGPPGMVVARTRLGSTRVVDLPIGEQPPQIC